MNPKIRARRYWSGLILLLIALGNSGCMLVAAGVAGGAGYAYYKGNVTQTFDAIPMTVWRATVDALSDLGMEVTSHVHELSSFRDPDQGNVVAGQPAPSEGTIKSVTATGKKVSIRIKAIEPEIPVDSRRTKVSVRVATFGDEEVSQRILNQIAVRLNQDETINSASAPSPATASAPTP